ncbi:amidase domain-containing protein [Streptomyces collinus]|uniref:amidase domain-containing protein n=1 Tax=Streptomyces collinus TaxID=42684 RepID=UPI0033C19043
MDVFYTDGDPLPAATTGLSTSKYASISRSGIVSWAAKHYGVKDDLRTDCTNFASKALNRGGGAHMEYGSIVDTKYNPYQWWGKSSSNMTYSWTAANNFANSMGNEDSLTWVTKVSHNSPGDIMLLDYRETSGSNLDHAGVIYRAGSTTSSVEVYRHSSHYRKTTLSAIIKRRSGVKVYLAHITPHWYRNEDEAQPRPAARSGTDRSAGRGRRARLGSPARAVGLPSGKPEQVARGDDHWRQDDARLAQALHEALRTTSA